MNQDPMHHVKLSQIPVEGTEESLSSTSHPVQLGPPPVMDSSVPLLVRREENRSTLWRHTP